MSRAADAPVAGRWLGDLDALAGGVVVFRLSGPRDGLAGTLDLPARLVFGAALERPALEGDRLSFDCPAAELELSATLGGDTLTGWVTLAGTRGRVVCERTIALDPGAFRRDAGEYVVDGREVMLGLVDDPFMAEPTFFYAEGGALVPLFAVAPGELRSERGEALSVREPGCLLDWRAAARTATARRAFPYREREVAFDAHGARLSGTLMSSRERPSGAIVLLHGAAPKERDLYRVYGRCFCRAGLAALVFDRRGHGASTGDGESTIFERAADAEAAVDHLRDREGIANVGLWAFSNGTWSAPIAAARRPEVRCLVCVGAAGVTMAEAETHRKLVELREAGVAEELVAEVARCWRLVYRFAGRGSLDDAERRELDELLARLAGEQALAAVPLEHFVQVAPVLSPVPPWSAASELDPLVTGPDAELVYDPVDDYRRLRAPVFFAVGEHDRNVPARASAERVEHALRASGCRDFRVEVYPGTGHSMNLEPPGAPVPPFLSLHGFRFAPGFLETMTQWVAERLEAL